jgi:TatD DNase family protein
MRFHDTHFHLDLMPVPEETARQIEHQGVYTIAVTNSPTVFFFTEKLALDKKYIRPALGLHPELVAERHKEVEQFVQLISKTRYIGEIGLDNQNKIPSDYLLQKKTFEKIVLACADAGGKILTIHSRKAAQDVIDILGKNFPGKIILHWYSGTMSQLQKAINNGYYFSINYPMLNSKSGKEIIKKIPIERLLIETDGPFTKRGEELFTPLMACDIQKELASLVSIGQTSGEAEKIIGGNFERLLDKDS